MRDLEAELGEYERLKSDGPKLFKLNSLDALPKVLIEESKRVLPPDLRRRIWASRASDYQTASLARLLGIARVLNLGVHEGTELVTK